MKVRIQIQTVDDTGMNRQSEVWTGDLDIIPDNEYLTRIMLIGDGQPQPLCDIPWSIGRGHYMWIPPETSTFPFDLEHEAKE